MPRLCIRSAWIVSPFTRQWSGLAAAPKAKSLLPVKIPRPIQFKPSPRFLSSFPTHATRPLYLARNADEHPSAAKPEYEHTVAQVARAASQAVRVAVHEGNVRDAYFVVNSMLQSPLEPGINPPVSSRRPLNPMDFGRPVPSRLAVHSLVHSLMRAGHTIAAGREIQKMIAIGVRFRSRTIEANVGLLCSGPSQQVENDVSPIEEQPNEHPQRLNDPTRAPRDSRASRALEKGGHKLNAETRLALGLLSTARQSRHRRTKRMYGWLVDACLLQGEIVVGTLLFVLLVKDWQLRKVLQSMPIEQAETVDNAEGARTEKPSEILMRLDLPRRTFAKQTGLDDRALALPYPDQSILQSILGAINHNMFSPESGRNTRSEALKALSILANLVDQRSLPFGNLSQLIKVLSSCPASPRRNIYVFKDGRHLHVSVYDHVHEVLLQLCRSLPSERPSPSLSRPEMLPPFDMHAYNSLIHYALRHRLSPALADTVIGHMTRHRNPPLQPDVVTYNIMVRSATLLRNSEMAHQVLDKLRRGCGNAGHVIVPVLPEDHLVIAESSSAAEPIPPASKGFSLTRHRAAVERTRIPDAQTPSFESHSDNLPRIDAYTLSSYITHLVSTGQPQVVADLIFHLLPELHVIDHPADDSPSAHDGREQWIASRQECILRAVAYGPYVFSAFLNALQKAGKTGLAERVWLLARQAERASWIPSDRPDAPAPWCLPIHAYTSMMQCYAAESRKGVALIRGSRFSHSLSFSLSLMQERQAWTPQRSGNIYVKGWAYFFLRMQAQEQGFKDAEPPLRWKISRDVGYLLLKSMRNGAMSVWQQLMDLQQENARQCSPQWAARLQTLQLPVGDARFFNVVLDMFGRRPNMQARRVRASPSWWNRKLRITQKLYGDSGWLSMAHDHTLVEIARGMADAGLALPLGLRRALVGRVTFRIQDGQRQDDKVRPLAFPRPTQLNFRPFAVPVTKSRGLPLGRRRSLVVRRSRRRSREAD